MARKIYRQGVVFPYQTVATTLSQTLDLNALGDSFSFQVDFEDVTTAYKDFLDSDVNTTDDTATIADHGQVTGSLGRLTTTDTLPGGLSLATNYWLIVVDINTLQFASSLADAAAGTFIDLTDQGVGRHTFTPTVSAGNIIKARMSNNGVSFTDINKLNLITNAASVAPAAGVTDTALWDFGEPNCKFLNVLFTPASGITKFQVTLVSWVNV